MTDAGEIVKLKTETEAADNRDLMRAALFLLKEITVIPATLTNPVKYKSDLYNYTRIAIAYKLSNDPSISTKLLSQPEYKDTIVSIIDSQIAFYNNEQFSIEDINPPNRQLFDQLIRVLNKGHELLTEKNNARLALVITTSEANKIIDDVEKIQTEIQNFWNELPRETQQQLIKWVKDKKAVKASETNKNEKVLISRAISTYLQSSEKLQYPPKNYVAYLGTPDDLEPLLNNQINYFQVLQPYVNVEIDTAMGKYSLAELRKEIIPHTISPGNTKPHISLTAGLANGWTHLFESSDEIKIDVALQVLEKKYYDSPGSFKNLPPDDRRFPKNELEQIATAIFNIRHPEKVTLTELLNESASIPDGQTFYNRPQYEHLMKALELGNNQIAHKGYIDKEDRTRIIDSIITNTSPKHSSSHKPIPGR